MQTTKETVEPVANSAIDSAFTTLGYAPPEPPQNKKQEKSDLPLPNNQESEAGFKAKQALAFLTKNADEKGGQKTWDAWMEVARGYAYGRDYAKNVAGGKTNGKIYANAMGWFLTKYDLGDDHLHKSTRSRLLSCYEHRDEIEEWRKNQDGRVLNNPVLVWQAFKKPKRKPATTASGIVEQLTNRYGVSPHAVAKDVIEKKCRLEGKKTHNAAMAKAVAEQLMEAVDAAERQSKEKKNDNLYHFGHDFLAEVSKAILALEAKATEKEANKKTGKK